MTDLPDESGNALTPEPSAEDRLSLMELLDRVLDKGVVLSGEVTLSVADVDLVYLGLRVLLSSVHAADRLRGGDSTGAGSGTGAGTGTGTGAA
jgi:hypothetical protein